MIHPYSKLQWISDHVGYGLFATQKIPKGSITFVQDPLDIRISTDSPLLNDKRIRASVEKYSYINNESEFVISWDIAKYMNHCCYANTLTTAWGFEIAVRDIEPGEEITDDYGLFTIRHDMKISCSKPNCRGKVSIDDFYKMVPYWDDQIKSALKVFNQPEQPLKAFLTDKVVGSVNHFINTEEGYLSVTEIKHTPSQFDFWLQKTR